MNPTYDPFKKSEIRRKKNEGYGAAFGRVLNNFHFYFRGGYYRFIANDAFMNLRGYSDGTETEGRSPLRLQQTRREFYAEVDKVVEELGISYDRVCEVVDVIVKRGNDTDFNEEAVWKPAWQTLIPIYVALRRRGYNSRDITG
jgi:hypothetical protein